MKQRYADIGHWLPSTETFHTTYAPKIITQEDIGSQIPQNDQPSAENTNDLVQRVEWQQINESSPAQWQTAQRG